MKKFLVIVFTLLLIVTLFTACNTVKVEKDQELLMNGNFDNAVTGWTTFAAEDEKLPSVNNVQSGQVEYAETGDHYLTITSSKYNTLSQTVAIEKESTYLLSAKIKVTSMSSSSGVGAFVGIDSNAFTVQSLTQTGDWQTLTCYFDSGDFDEVVVRIGVGTDTANTSGTAYFDAISLKKVDKTGTLIQTLTGDPAATQRFDAKYLTNKSGIIFTTLTTVLGGLALYAMYVVLRRLMSKKGAFLSPDSAADGNVGFFKSAAFMLIICELVAFALRLITINFIYGGPTLGGYVNESTQLVDLGAREFYFDKTSTTPIGSLYLLWVLGLIAKPLNLISGSMGYAIFLKIPAVLADLVAVFVIFYLANNRYNQYVSALFAGAYAVLPVFFFLSAGWGAYSSIGALFILLSLAAFLDKKYVTGIVYYSVALLFMTEAMLLLPLLLVYVFYVFFTKGDDQKMAISISVTASVIVLYLISLPFTLSYFAVGKPFAALTSYISAFLAHTGFTENAFTVYGLFGLGATEANVAATVFSSIFVAAVIIGTVILYFKSKSRLDLLLLSAFTFVATFILTSAVDTILIYPALLLLLVYGIISGDRRALKLFGGFSVTTLLNTSYTMMIGGYFGAGHNSALIYMTAGDPVLIIFSIMNFLLLVYFAYVVYSICVKEEIKGVVIIEENYFKYFVKKVKETYAAVVTFFKEKVIARFAKKEEGENAGESK